MSLRRQRGDAIRGCDGAAAAVAGSHHHNGQLLPVAQQAGVGENETLLRWLSARQHGRLLLASEEERRQQLEEHWPAQGGVQQRRSGGATAWHQSLSVGEWGDSAGDLSELLTGAGGTRADVRFAVRNEGGVDDAGLLPPVDERLAMLHTHRVKVDIAARGSATPACQGGAQGHREGHRKACSDAVARSTSRRQPSANKRQLASRLAPGAGLSSWQAGVLAQEQTRKRWATAAAAAQVGPSFPPSDLPSLRFPPRVPPGALHALHAARTSLPRSPLPAVPARALRPAGSHAAQCGAAQPLAMREVRALTLAIAQAVATGDQVGAVTPLGC